MLHRYDFETETWLVIGETGTENLRALEFDNLTKTLYGIDEGKLGTVNIETGLFTSFGNVNTGNGTYGSISLNEIVSLAYHTKLKVLYAVHRIPGEGPGTNDVLFQIDPSTGLIKQNAMVDPTTANMVDYVTIGESFLYGDNPVDGYDVAGIIYHPYTHQLLGLHTINEQFGSNINELNQQTGAIESKIYDTHLYYLTDIFTICMGQLIGAQLFEEYHAQLETIDLTKSDFYAIGSFDPTKLQSLACSYPVNDLALQVTLTPSTKLPINDHQFVNFDVYVFNQGDVKIEEFELTGYFSTDDFAIFDLGDPIYTNNGKVSRTFYYNIEPGDTFKTQIRAITKKGIKGTVRAAVEISDASVYDITHDDDYNNTSSLLDIDSNYDDLDNEMNIVDNEINGINNDEDDHDIVEFKVNLPECNCYSVAQNNGADNELFQYDSYLKEWKKVGKTGTNNLKALAYISSSQKLYGIEKGQIGTFNVYSGQFNSFGEVNTGEGEYGTLTLDDIEGLAYDARQEVMYAVHRVPGDGPGTNDVLFKIDIETGKIIKNGMTNPRTDNLTDYVVIEEVFMGDDVSREIYDVTGITYDVYNNQLIALHTLAGNNQTVITELNKNTGELFSILWDVHTDFFTDVSLNKNGQFVAIANSGNNENLEQLVTFNLPGSELIALAEIDNSQLSNNFQSLACHAPVNDLALSIVHNTETLALPFVISDEVNYDFLELDITIHNQGEIAVDEFMLSISPIEVLDSIDIVYEGWAIHGNIASKNFQQNIEPGRRYTITNFFLVKEGYEGLVKLNAEIASAFNYDITNSNGNPFLLADIDSQYDAINNELNIIDNELNGGGAFVNEDEDDHDIVYIQVYTNATVNARLNKIESPCYAIAHNNGEINTLSVYNPAENYWYIVDIIGTTGIKALAINHTNNLIYAIDDGTLGTINPYSGEFEPIGTVNTGNGPLGSIILDNIYGLTFDAEQGVLYASHRIKGNNDVIFQIDPLTGLIIPDVYTDYSGNPVDYDAIPTFAGGIGEADVRDITGLTINPFTGALYVMIANRLSVFDKYTMDYEITAVIWDKDDKLGAVTFVSEHEVYTTNYQPNGETQLVLTDLQTQTNTPIGALDQYNTVTGFLSLDCSQSICVDEKNISETYTGQGVITSGIYQADQTINSDGIINGIDQNVTYKAGIEINLEAGFEVKAGSEFLADIEGCD